MTYLMHETPGRLRIKIPSLKRNQREGDRLHNLITDIEGINNATVNPITGSIVVTFDDTVIDSKGILAILIEENFLDPKVDIQCEQHVSHVVDNVGNFVSKAVVGLFVDRALQGTPLGFLSALI